MRDGFPHKAYYKIGEVCQYTDTQPYVLRFWESEFPQLAPEKNRSGQRVYRRDDIELIFKIKKLLYEQEYTIAGARKRLEQEASGEVLIDDEVAVTEPETEAPAPRLFPDPSVETLEHDDRATLEDLLPDAPETVPSPAAAAPAPSEEVEVLRNRVSLLEDDLRRAEAARVAAEAQRDAYRQRMNRVAARLEEVARRIEDEDAATP